MLKKTFERRKYIIIAIFLILGFIYILRLFFLQVLQNEYKLSADSNVLRYVTQYPARGLVYDRNGKLLVINEAAYDLLVLPKQVKAFDTTELCTLLKIDREDFRRRLLKARQHSMFKPSIFLEQISKEDFGYLEEKLYKFPGFYIQPRTLRSYPNPMAAHLLGYIGEVGKSDIESNTYYKQGDYIGKSGLEKSYEELLRGKKGLRIRLVDVHNREMGSYMDGKYDTAALAGRDIHITIDADLQAYGERLMQNKRGSIVAIEPATGEILALVSSPSYDPNLLVGRIRSKNFNILNQDTLKPLFNRATMAQYPPGSSFKTVNTVIALQEGVLNINTRYGCHGVSTKPIACSHNHPAPLDLLHAIEQSCNPYFWQVFKSILNQPKFRTTQQAFNHWRELVSSFGIGSQLESDIPDQADGNLPTDSYYNKYFGVNGWTPLTIRSLSVGQGEIELTPLQMANLVATIANRGFYCPPHVLKDVIGGDTITDRFKKKINTAVSPQYFYTLVDGMRLVFQGASGTARYYKIEGIECCGKTGTAQNPHGANHSVFIAFAPADNPKIAVAVVVENSGYGATWAAPIASLIMEKYLKGDIKNKAVEDRMINADFIH
jgi:penicillin-binding protein 2